MGKKKTEILTSYEGFTVVMASGTVVKVRAVRAEYSSTEILFLRDDGSRAARFRLKDVSGIIDIASS